MSNQNETNRYVQGAPIQNAPALYFVNAPVDFFFIGGASIALCVLMALFTSSERTTEIIAAAIFLNWVINWPHFSMSTYRLYQSKSNVRQYPFTALVIPFLVVGALVLSFAYPTTVAPYFVKLFLIWSPYHFSGQTVGITLIYARRAGIKINKVERLILSSFVFGTFFLATIRSEASREGRWFFGIKYPTFGVPQWLITLTEYGMWIAIALFFVVIIFWCYKKRRIVPLIVLLPAATQYVWFIQSVYMPAFQELVPMFHSLQYILIAWGIQLKEKLDIHNITPSKKYVFTETARWSAVNIAGGILLFYLLPGIGVAFGYSSALSVGLFLAAIQIHHFFVDGVIWKLKNQTVSHPLMMNVRDITQPQNTDRGVT